MTEVQKHFIGVSRPSNVKFDDLIARNIVEAAEDEDYYYIVAPIPGDTIAYMVGKKDHEVRETTYIEYIANVICAEQNPVPEMKPPYHFE